MRTKVKISGPLKENCLAVKEFFHVDNCCTYAILGHMDTIEVGSLGSILHYGHWTTDKTIM